MQIIVSVRLAIDVHKFYIKEMDKGNICIIPTYIVANWLRDMLQLFKSLRIAWLRSSIYDIHFLQEMQKLGGNPNRRVIMTKYVCYVMNQLQYSQCPWD